MNIDGVNSGIVIDHIKAGMGMKIYEYLGLEDLDCCVALIKNVRSTKYGKKDIIKIDAEIDLNLEILGYIDPNVTVNFIRDGKLFKKRHLAVPERLVNVIRCKIRAVSRRPNRRSRTFSSSLIPNGRSIAVFIAIQSMTIRANSL